jgi:dolichol-phosphate mannosyltransferase
MSEKKSLISIIIPVFNEEEGVEIITNKLIEVFAELPKYDYEIICVDDGSDDGSLKVLEILNKNNSRIKYLSFSRNFGHQTALKAGLDIARGDCAITMDADMQHPPELIPELLKKWEEGYEVVFTIRKDDKKLPFFKRLFSRIYYKVVNLLSDIHIDPGAADFRLTDRKVLNILKNLSEEKLFLRGMVNWLGFNHYGIDYYPGVRAVGETKYSFRKMISLGVSGITSFSVRPLRIAAWIGLFASSLGFFYGIYAIYGFIIGGVNLTGWTSLITAVIFLGGVQLMTLGIIGEYIGKLFMQMKGRPNYIVKKSSKDED